MSSASLRRIVVGIGNPDRGDDAAGRAVAQALRGTLPDGIDIVELSGEAAALIDALDGAGTAYLVDACLSGAPAGTVRRLDASSRPLPPGALGLSTHGLGVAAAVELARALGQLPPRCIVYAIEGGSFEPGAAMSPLVSEAIAGVAARLRGELETAAETGG